MYSFPAFVQSPITDRIDSLSFSSQYVVQSAEAPIGHKFESTLLEHVGVIPIEKITGSESEHELTGVDFLGQLIGGVEVGGEVHEQLVEEAKATRHLPSDLHYQQPTQLITPPVAEKLEQERSRTAPQSTVSSIDSGLAKTSSSDEDEYDLDTVGRAVDQDESIAWLQERIEAMNQTLEAYESEGRRRI